MNATRISFCLSLAVALAACQSKPLEPVIPEPPVQPDPVEPAKLELAGTLSSAKATVGQPLTLELTVTNTGASVALSVTTSPLSQNGTGRVRIVGSPAGGAMDLAPGEQQKLSVQLEATDPGVLTLGALVEAMDGPTGSTVSAELPGLELAIESPPLLTLERAEAPQSADVGQDVEVSVTVANEGEATAQLVAGQVDAIPGSVGFDRIQGPTPAAATIAAGGRQTFTFIVRPRTAGSLSLEARAFGIDANHQVAVQSEPMAVPGIAVETPARLTAELVIPDLVTAGQQVTATLVVRNEGEAVARGVVPVPAMPVATTVSGTATATASAAPAAQDVPGGSTATFTWVYVASGSGTFSLASRVRGTGLNSGAVVEAVAPAQTVSVVPPSALQIVELSAPSPLNPTQGFDLTVKVKNTGGSAANGVSIDPAPPSIVAAQGASARLVTAAAAQTIAPGATATFVFRYAENGTGPGSLRFTAGARGVDSLSGLPITAIATTSNLVLVAAVPALLVEAITLPAKVTRGQTFPVGVRVRNTGGTPAANVKPNVSFVLTGDAEAIEVTPATPAVLAGGARTTFTVQVRETGIGSGTLRVRSTASGTNPNFGNNIVSGAVVSPVPATLVQQPASLQIVTFLLPATLNRGGRFSLGMVVANSGQADARLVGPSLPTLARTGGANAAVQTSPVAMTIPGLTSRTFTWTYRENGTAAGTLGFTAGAAGVDGNSTAPVSATSATSNVAAVEVYLGCNGSQLHPALDGHLLDADRLELTAQTDRLRVKAYSSLPGEYARVFGVTTAPASIRAQDALFDTAPARWFAEQELSAMTLFRTYIAAYQACVTLVTGPAAYMTAPTASTANAQCAAWQRRFWSATPSAAQTAACASFAVSADNDGATPQQKWAATCATTIASLGFLAE